MKVFQFYFRAGNEKKVSIEDVNMNQALIAFASTHPNLEVIHSVLDLGYAKGKRETSEVKDMNELDGMIEVGEQPILEPLNETNQQL